MLSEKSGAHAPTKRIEQTLSLRNGCPKLEIFIDIGPDGKMRLCLTVVNISGPWLVLPLFRKLIAEAGATSARNNNFLFSYILDYGLNRRSFSQPG